MSTRSSRCSPTDRRRGARGGRGRRAAGRRERGGRLRQHRRARRGRARHHGVQHARRARRDDRRPRVHVDPRRVPARVTTPKPTCAPAGGTGWGITQYLGRDVHGATLGIVGYGRIGRAVARRADGLRHARAAPRPHRHRRAAATSPTSTSCSPTSDIVSLHVPGGDGDAPPDRRPPARAHEADRGAREHRARHRGRRGRARRRAARRALVRGRARRVRARARGRTRGCSSAPRTVLLPHIGSASQATRTRMATTGDVGGRDGARGRDAAQRRAAVRDRARRSPRMSEQVRGVVATVGEAAGRRSRRSWCPIPGPGEVTVRVQACGVCHTDLHYREGGIGDDFPYLLGHEAAGVVDAVGPGVTGVAPGDFVVLNWRAVCGECRACRRGPAVVLLRHAQRAAEDDARRRHAALARARHRRVRGEDAGRRRAGDEGRRPRRARRRPGCSAAA